MKTQISQYIAEVSKFLNLAAEGELIAKLTPDITDFTTLKNVVSQHDSFKSLFFFKDPTYFYVPATIAIVEILVQDSFIHFVFEYSVILEIECHAIIQNGPDRATCFTKKCIYFQIPSFRDQSE